MAVLVKILFAFDKSALFANLYVSESFNCFNSIQGNAAINNSFVSSVCLYFIPSPPSHNPLRSRSPALDLPAATMATAKYLLCQRL
jgi:hypothetical protein